MKEESIAKQVAAKLSEILGISDNLEYEAKLNKAFKSPIDAPLDKLKNKLYKFDQDENQFRGIEEINGVTVFDKTLAMRKLLASFLNEKDLQITKRNIIAKWIVEDWGGITSDKKTENDIGAVTSSETSNINNSLYLCLDIADQADKGEGKFKFERVASWSKYLAFKAPQKYAIYDARVIYSLNWLLYQANASQFLPFPSGRNSVMELLDYKVYLFLGRSGQHADKVEKFLNADILRREPQSKLNSKSAFFRNLKKELNLFVSDGDAFAHYCSLLNEVSKELFLENDEDRLTKTEMLLFAIADTEIARAVLDFIRQRSCSV